jgi:signal transduction histidine kinase
MLHRFNRFLVSALFLSTGALMPATHSAGTPTALTLPQLEQRLSDIDSQIGQLARYTPRGGFGSIGYRSAEFDGPDHSTSLRVDLAEAMPVDQVVLVPTIIRDPATGFRPDGFPQTLRILDEHGTVLAERNYTDEHRHRIAPHIIQLNGNTVSSLIIEATRLSQRAFDGKYVFQLAELLVFNGAENVALRRPVKASSFPRRYAVTAWGSDYVTDGSLPYLMNSAQGTPSRAYLSPRKDATDGPLVLSIDLQQAYSLDQLNLHSVDQSDTIPQGSPGGIGMPRHLLVEGANQPDFSDARSLLEARFDSEFEAAPTMMWPLSGVHCRYVRLTALEPYLYPFEDGPYPRIGFAEIELLSSSQNVASGKPFVVPGEQIDDRRPAVTLTDQRNIFGQVLPMRQWLEELALRYELETERPLVSAELTKRYARQKENLRRMIWLATFLAGVIGFTILFDRMLRMRKLAQLKERFAADLHDELGANLHTIGLLSQLARKKMASSPEDASRMLQRIDNTTKRSSIAVRNVTALQAANGLYTNLENDMELAAQRILVKITHELDIKGGEYLPRLKPRTQLDLFLFYKECLINISRHSKATQASTRLQADGKQITLRVTDNGSGLSESEMPASLKRRAKLFGAQASVTTIAEGGSCITLTFKPRKWPLRIGAQKGSLKL